MTPEILDPVKIHDALIFLGKCILAAGILTRFNASPSGLKEDVDKYVNAFLT